MTFNHASGSCWMISISVENNSNKCQTQDPTQSPGCAAQAWVTTQISSNNNRPVKQPKFTLVPTARHHTLIDWPSYRLKSQCDFWLLSGVALPHINLVMTVAHPRQDAADTSRYMLVFPQSPFFLQFTDQF